MNGLWIEVFGLESKRRREISLQDKAVRPYSEENWNESNALERHPDELVIPIEDLAFSLVSVKTTATKSLDLKRTTTEDGE